MAFDLALKNGTSFGLALASGPPPKLWVSWAQVVIPAAGTPPPVGTYYYLLFQPNYAARFAAMLRH